MNDWRSFDRPDHRKYRLLREALADVRALVPEDIGPDGKPLPAEGGPAPAGAAKEGEGLRLDAAANLIVLCAIVAVVLAGAADEGVGAALRSIA